MLRDRDVAFAKWSRRMTWPPLSIDNPPSTAVCGCDCGCRKQLTPGNAMAQEIASAYDAPGEAIERVGDAPNGGSKIIWHIDLDTLDAAEMAEAPVVLLICADCFVGNHREVPRG